jgi:cellulose synthase/poly-beta-1,6-N-acetylglucosamine synthase-like glycosyltransferase
VLRLVFQVVGARRHRARLRRQSAVPSPRPPRTPLSVSVIVPAHNEAANIAATVRSLTAGTHRPSEVIVVDDGSTDGTAAIVTALGLSEVRVVRRSHAGKAAAVNAGIAAATSDVVVLVDADTVFAPDAIARLLQPFADATVGAVSGNTKVANPHRLLGRWQHLEYVVAFNLDRRLFDVAGCMPTVSGTIGAFRRCVLEEVGGLSADTLAEDTDLTMAVIRAGWRVVYEETAVAWTEAPTSLRQLWRQRYRWCYGTMQAMWKHRRCLVEGGNSNRLGRRGLSYLLSFHVLLPLVAPAIDVYLVYGLTFLPWWQVTAVWLGLMLLQTATAAYALRLDNERWRALWTLPLQQVVYRQLTYLLVLQATVAALLGTHQRWQGTPRTGQAELALVSSGSRPNS